VVTTHQVEELERVLTDVMFLNHGRIAFSSSMEEFEARYLELNGSPGTTGGGAGAEADVRAGLAWADGSAVRRRERDATGGAGRRYARPDCVICLWPSLQSGRLGGSTAVCKRGRAGR